MWAIQIHLSFANVLGGVRQIQTDVLLPPLAQRNRGGNRTGGLPPQLPFQGLKADPIPQLLGACGRMRSQSFDDNMMTCQHAVRCMGVNPGDSRSLKGQTWTLLASVTADHPCHTCGNQCQRALFVMELLQTNNRGKKCTSMQRQGRGLEYWSRAFLTGSSFLI